MLVSRCSSSSRGRLRGALTKSRLSQLRISTLASGNRFRGAFDLGKLIHIYRPLYASSERVDIVDVQLVGTVRECSGGCMTDISIIKPSEYIVELSVGRLPPHPVGVRFIHLLLELPLQVLDVLLEL